MISANGIEKVYFEKPIIPKVTSFDTVYGLMGLATAIGFAADEAGIDCIAIDQQTWRSEFGVPTQAPKKIKGATERRAWLKQQTMDRCRHLGMDVQDDNAADATALWFAMSRRILEKEASPQFDFTQTLAM